MPVQISPARLFVVEGTRMAPSGAVPVRALGAWQKRDTMENRYVRTGSAAYVQLERRDSGEHEPVSISSTPVENAMNLRGRVRRRGTDGTVDVDYGLDAFYMQEGTAKPVEDALLAGRVVQMQVAIAASGRARIRTLLVDGVPVR